MTSNRARQNMSSALWTNLAASSRTYKDAMGSSPHPPVPPCSTPLPPFCPMSPQRPLMRLRSPPRHQRHDGYTSRSALLWNTNHGPRTNERAPRRVTDPPDMSQPPGMLGTLTMGWIWRVTSRENKGTRARWGGGGRLAPPVRFFFFFSLFYPLTVCFLFVVATLTCSRHPPPRATARGVVDLLRHHLQDDTHACEQLLAGWICFTLDDRHVTTTTPHLQTRTTHARKQLLTGWILARPR
jgi:hypothetical protein